MFDLKKLNILNSNNNNIGNHIHYSNDSSGTNIWMSDRTCNGDYDVKYIETISLDNVSTYQIDSTIVF